MPELQARILRRLSAAALVVGRPDGALLVRGKPKGIPALRPVEPAPQAGELAAGSVRRSDPGEDSPRRAPEGQGSLKVCATDAPGGPGDGRLIPGEPQGADVLGDGSQRFFRGGP